MMKRFWELLFPSKCVLCSRILEKEELDLCRKCRTDVPRFGRRKEHIRFVRDYTAAWYYEEKVRGSILRYKFRGVRSYSGAYGRAVAMRIVEDLPEEIDVLTWVPTGPKRKLERGYDQVELLAQAVSEELGMSAQRLLRKPRDNQPQSSLKTAEQRRANVLGVYEITDRSLIQGKNILLLDDIITTGATVSECARVMQTAGAKNIYCAAVAVVRNHKQ